MRICVAAGWLCLASLAQAATWYVAPPPAGSDDNDGTSSWAQAFATISNAVAKAVAPDIILLTNGTHGVQAEVAVTKGVTIQGFGGRDNTCVARTGAQTNRIFRLTHANAVLDGLTVSGGYLTNASGAGIHITLSTVRNCTITGNVISNGGVQGGAGVYMASGMLTNCIITMNANTNANGGGIILVNGMVKNCTIVSNIANCGGGIYIQGGTNQGGSIISNRAYLYGAGVYAAGGTIRNCSIVTNISASAGGGIYTVPGSPVLVDNCLIASNYATTYFGGAVIDNGGTIRNSIVRNNRAVSQSGGMLLGAASTYGYAYNCLVVGNSSGSGGGISIRGVNSSINNCTIVSNLLGGGIAVDNANQGIIRNSIVYYNAGGDFIGKTNTVNPVSYSCASSFKISDPSNITNEPIFMDPVNGDYHLKGSSPCHDRGTTNVQATYTYDLDYVPHKDCTYCGSTIPDMGCYELNVLYKGTVFRAY